ncbi:hypothetical protein [Dysgonomonas capnocytophagoides]|uniref:hypothetical protein n=1 Tax=Dysgonomonas capnocytophagoides TaxID=45254 RepID=UPI0030C7C257
MVANYCTEIRVYTPMAILWDDTDMYKSAVDVLLGGNDNGIIPNYNNQEWQRVKKVEEIRLMLSLA